MSEPITCREVVELVTAYLNEDLEPAERVVLEQHLLTCPPCTTHVEQMRTTVAVVGTLRGAGAAAPPSTLEIFRKWKAAK